MKKTLFLSTTLILFSIIAVAQSGTSGNRVLIEEFTETGCGACAEYDSSFQALTNANADKVAVLNYHCFYALDTFYIYNKACDTRYAQYDIAGFPGAAVNGKKPTPSSGHLTYVNQPLIDKLYDTPPQFKFNIKCKPNNKGNAHSSTITVTATALKDNPSQDLKLLIVATENNIDHTKRYGAKSTNGLNNFNHIVRAFLPDKEGSDIGDQKAGKTNTVKVTFNNDDKEINFKEVRIVAFIQDAKTHEVFGCDVTNDNPF
jgi:hypothetical protein